MPKIKKVPLECHGCKPVGIYEGDWWQPFKIFWFFSLSPVEINMKANWYTKAKIMKTCALLPAGGEYLQVYPEDVWQIKGKSYVPNSCAD